MPTETKTIRPSYLAGLHYPAEKLVLERDLSLFLEAAPALQIPSPIRGMIVPHGPYVLSGGVAARAYRHLLDHHYDLIILVADAHEDAFDFVSIYSGDGFDSPLGVAPIDKTAAFALEASHDIFRFSTRGYGEVESHFEVQIPFLKWIMSDVAILPLVIGNPSENLLSVLWEKIVDFLNSRNAILIACTNLSNNRPDDQARGLDQITMSYISSLLPDVLLKDALRGRCELCDPGAVYTTMKAGQAMGAQQGKVLLYRNSSDITGDKQSVSGFMSAILY